MDVITLYGPFSWVFGGFVGILIFALIYWLWSVARKNVANAEFIRSRKAHLLRQIEASADDLQSQCFACEAAAACPSGTSVAPIRGRIWRYYLQELCTQRVQ